MAKKELQVSAIENGTVIDHIPADKLFDVINVLGITGMDNAMTFGANLKSSKLGKKAIIKIWDKFLEDDEVNKLALVAPSAKINIIRDYDVVEKKTVNVPEKVEKQLVIDMDKDYNKLEAPVVPHIKATQDRVTLEIQRGCIRGCRFCQAGMIYRPTRERDIETLKESARIMLQKTGHEEISLSSLSSSDYSHLKEIVNFLIDEFRDEAVNISLPSLRIDAFALDVMSKVQDVKKSSLTFAPEAGSQRLRNVINKGLTEEDILHGAGEAFKGGWNQVKLYFMLGLPTETEDDMKGIAHLAQKIAETYYEVVPKEQRKGKVQINVSTSFFVPKPFTPFQWAPMFREEDFIEKAKVEE